MQDEYDEYEEWRPIEEFPHYLVSSLGRIKHVNRNEPRAIMENNRGVPVIILFNPPGRHQYQRQLNTLVARAFLPEPEFRDQTSIWHIDGDFMNCRAENLRWETRPRVLEWNKMHRTRQPQYRTPQVKNNKTGVIYDNAYECAMAEGVLESTIIWRIERQASHLFDDTARYRYVT